MNKFLIKRKSTLLNLIIFGVLLLMVISCNAETSEGKPKFQEPKGLNVQDKLLLLEQKVDQVKSNQLNYKIEKDLLKETYSNNHSRVQTIISIVLGLITIIGFLGLNSITNTKKEYEKELEILKSLKSKHELDYKKLIENQKTVEENIEKLNSLNQSQDGKLKLLEIKEKISTLISNSEYLHALEYITIGLDSNPNDITLLELKSSCHFKLKNYDEAIEINESILQLKPDNKPVILELAELYLIVDDNDKFKRFVGSHEKLLMPTEKNIMGIFFDVMYNFNIGESKKILELTTSLLNKLKENDKQNIANWDFSDILKYINSKDESEIQKSVKYFINIANGNWSKSDYHRFTKPEEDRQNIKFE